MCLSASRVSVIFQLHARHCPLPLLPPAQHRSPPAWAVSLAASGLLLPRYLTDRPRYLGTLQPSASLLGAQGCRGAMLGIASATALVC